MPRTRLGASSPEPIGVAEAPALVSSGSTHVIVDIFGFYDDGRLEFVPDSAATARSLTTNARPRNLIRQPAATPSLQLIK